MPWWPTSGPQASSDGSRAWARREGNDMSYTAVSAASDIMHFALGSGGGVTAIRNWYTLPQTKETFLPSFDQLGYS